MFFYYVLIDVAKGFSRLYNSKVGVIKMEYKALYRKLRPKGFEEGYIAQQHIRITLQNSLANNKIAHAYLFSGPRGTGKTSTAKIFAKAVNCLEGPTSEPCNKCDSCAKINENNSLDVLEIDAASNRGIDEIRELRDRVNYAPSESRYKVYIIDEVHMLTTEAFNALLKTLEEPPTHVIFILATTEPHKLPATILSRCQRYDFRRFTGEEIANYLMEVSEKHDVNLHGDAAKVLANKADGSMRDALSLLDQMIVYGHGRIDISLVLDVLGTLSPETIRELIEYMALKDIDKALELINIVVEEGKDINSFIHDIIESLRELMISKIKNDTQSNDISLSVNEIVRIIEIFLQGEKEIKISTHPKILLETIVLKAIEGDDRKISQLEKRIEELEIKISSNSVIQKQNQVVPQVKVNPTNKQAQLESLKKIWDKVLFSVKKENVSTHAWLKEGVLDNISDDTLDILYEDKYMLHRENVMKDNHRLLIEKTIETLLGQDIKIRAITKEGEHLGNKGVNDKKDSLVTIAEKLFGEDKVEVKD